MSADTLAQIEQVRSGQFTDWHAPLLLVLWRPFWLIGAGPGFVATGCIIIFELGLYGVLRGRFTRRAAAIGAVVITLLAPVLGWVIYLGRDTWFTAFFLVASGALVAVARTRGRWRVVAMVTLCVAVWLMQAARQNALATAAVLIFAMTWMVSAPTATAPNRRTWRRTFRCVAVTLGLVIVVMGSQGMMRRLFDVQSTHPEQALFIYDVAAISHSEQEVLFDPDVYPAQDLVLLDERFHASAMHAYVFGPGAVIPWPVPPEHIDDLRDDWIDAIRHHPGSYLRARLTLWLEEISITAPSSWVVHPVIDPNPWGYTARFPALDDALQRYLRLFAANDQLEGTLIHAVWIYLLVLVAGVAYLRSLRRVYQCLGWMSVSCLAYQASLFFGLMGAAYRLNVPCVVVATVIVLVAGADGVVAIRQRVRKGSGRRTSGCLATCSRREESRRRRTREPVSNHSGVDRHSMRLDGDRTIPRQQELRRQTS